MKKTKKIICLALVMLMVLSLAACGKTEEKGGELKPVEGGMFVYAIEEPITSLNYYNNSSTDLGLQVFKNIYDPLWYANADGTPDYRLAKSVEISEDGTTYTVTLRDDITWSDGKKITVDDLMFTLDILVKTTIMPSTSSAYKVDGTFCEYKKESDTVATITVGRGSNLFKKALGGLFLLPAHCFEGVALEDILTCKENDTIATSGAYKVDSFSVGEKIVCVKRDDYYRRKSHIDGFEVRVIGNAGTQEIAFQNGELALFTISNAETLATYKNDSNYKIVSYPDGRITFLEINPNAEATATLEMRQAIISALNIDELVYGTYGDAALCDSANSILSKVSMFYDPSVKNYTQDIEKAKKLIEETGIKDKEITIIYNSARVGQEEL
ncbi:MAG: ABC transporter substrate-binding protein, partial [Clostridia bacterium]|nr:ABC transporter substrate-binding protein [Clostridia bacterium]